MGVDPNRLGTAIYTFLQSQSIPQTSFITGAQLEIIWQGISNEIDTEYSNFAEVAPGTFIDSLSGAITGVGGPVS